MTAEVRKACSEGCGRARAVFKDLYGNLWDLLQYDESVPYRLGVI